MGDGFGGGGVEGRGGVNRLSGGGGDGGLGGLFAWGKGEG